MRRFVVAFGVSLASCSSSYTAEQLNVDDRPIGVLTENEFQPDTPFWLNAILLSDEYHYWTLIYGEDNCPAMAAGFEANAFATWLELKALDSSRIGVAISAEFFGIMEMDETDRTRSFTIRDYRNASVRNDIDLSAPLDWSSCELGVPEE
jgi:hypothetical protein